MRAMSTNANDASNTERTRPNLPMRLKARDTSHGGHSEEIEEYLGGVEHDGWF